MPIAYGFPVTGSRLLSRLLPNSSRHWISNVFWLPTGPPWSREPVATLRVACSAAGSTVIRYGEVGEGTVFAYSDRVPM